MITRRAPGERFHHLAVEFVLRIAEQPLRQLVASRISPAALTTIVASGAERNASGRKPRVMSVLFSHARADRDSPDPPCAVKPASNLGHATAGAEAKDEPSATDDRQQDCADQVPVRLARATLRPEARARQLRNGGGRRSSFAGHDAHQARLVIAGSPDDDRANGRSAKFFIKIGVLLLDTAWYFRTARHLLDRY